MSQPKTFGFRGTLRRRLKAIIAYSVARSAHIRSMGHHHMSTIDTVLEANRTYAEGFDQGGLPGRPTRLKLAVVTCMDCRLHVSKLLGLELADAHIVRNAGGIVTEDVLRSLIVSCHIAATREDRSLTVAAPPPLPDAWCLMPSAFFLFLMPGAQCLLAGVW